MELEHHDLGDVFVILSAERVEPEPSSGLVDEIPDEGFVGRNYFAVPVAVQLTRIHCIMLPSGLADVKGLRRASHCPYLASCRHGLSTLTLWVTSWGVEPIQCTHPVNPNFKPSTAKVEKFSRGYTEINRLATRPVGVVCGLNGWDTPNPILKIGGSPHKFCGHCGQSKKSADRQSRAREF